MVGADGLASLARDETLDSEPVLRLREGAVAVLVLNRPEAMNAWDRAMRTRIVALLSEFEQDDSLGAIVITGAGQRAFGAGQDLRERPIEAAEIDLWVDEWRFFFSALRNSSKPTVAALNGVAAGSAFQFALMADVRVGHPGIRMGQPELKTGIASSIGPWVIDAVLGPALAAELCLTGRLMDADECQRLGLLHSLVPAHAVQREAIRIAAELGARSRLATRLTKERLRALAEPGFQESFAIWKRFLRQTIEAGSAQAEDV